MVSCSPKKRTIITKSNPVWRVWWRRVTILWSLPDPHVSLLATGSIEISQPRRCPWYNRETYPCSWWGCSIRGERMRMKVRSQGGCGRRAESDEAQKKTRHRLTDAAVAAAQLVVLKSQSWNPLVVIEKALQSEKNSNCSRVGLVPNTFVFRSAYWAPLIDCCIGVRFNGVAAEEGKSEVARWQQPYTFERGQRAHPYCTRLLNQWLYWRHESA